MRYSFPKIAPHLTTTELAQRCQTCEDPIEKPRWVAIHLLSQSDQPKTAKQVAEILGFSPGWVYQQIQRYNRLGTEGLLSGQQRRQLRKQKRIQRYRR